MIYEQEIIKLKKENQRLRKDVDRLILRSVHHVHYAPELQFPTNESHFPHESEDDNDND